jgi:hypothetical protein
VRVAVERRVPQTPQSLGEFHARSCVGHAEAAACEDRGANLRVKLREAVRELAGLAVDDERAVHGGEDRAFKARNQDCQTADRERSGNRVASQTRPCSRQFYVLLSEAFYPVRYRPIL